MQMTLQQLKQAKQFFADHPAGIVSTPEMWPPKQYDRDQWQQWFFGCLNAKINRNVNHTGRKHSTDYWWSMRRAADELNHPRLAIHYLPPDLKQRFAHRLRENIFAEDF